MSESDELPEGWTAVSVGSVIKSLDQGWSPKCDNEPSGSINIWGVIKTTAVQAIEFDELANKRLPQSLKPRQPLEIQPGDLLMTRAGPRSRAGVCCLVRKTRPRLMICDKVYRFRAENRVVMDSWLLYALNTSSSIESIDALKTGTSDSGVNLTQDKFRDLSLPVAPLPEQRRIVERVETLLTEVNRVKGRLERVRGILKRFRQSVLAAACTGKLTEGWNEAPSQASAELESIRAEVIQLKTDDPRRRHKAKEVIAPRDAFETELPAHWCRCRVGELFDVVYGLSEPLRKTSPETRNDIPVISMANITPWGELVLSTVKYFEVIEPELSKLALRTGDLLFNWRNSPNWIGKTCRFDLSDRTYVNASFLLRMRPSRPGTYERFYRLVFNYLRASGYFEQASRAAVSQSNFNASEVSAMEVPFPSLEEQAEIVKRAEALFSLANGIEHRLRVADLSNNRLPEAILSKAFSGELVPTEAELALVEGRGYEPAAELLNRIKNQLDATSKAKQPRRGGSKAASS